MISLAFVVILNRTPPEFHINFFSPYSNSISKDGSPLLTICYSNEITRPFTCWIRMFILLRIDFFLSLYLPDAPIISLVSNVVSPFRKSPGFNMSGHKAIGWMASLKLNCQCQQLELLNQPKSCNNFTPNYITKCLPKFITINFQSNLFYNEI